MYFYAVLAYIILGRTRTDISELFTFRYTVKSEVIGKQAPSYVVQKRYKG